MSNASRSRINASAMGITVLPMHFLDVCLSCGLSGKLLKQNSTKSRRFYLVLLFHHINFLTLIVERRVK